jgi:TatD DNase family protein
MIDVHCHFDLTNNPEKYISDNEKKQIVSIGMTNLPSHFEMGVNRIKRYNYIRLALGMHPLRAEDHESEYSLFKQYVNNTSYIGEVGLDFSREGIHTKETQIKSFDFVLDLIKNKKKIISLHSRRAEKETFEMLIDKKIDSAIFHWYSGSIPILRNITKQGYYFSINSAMIKSINGRKIISEIPKELILTETDHPFIENSNINLVIKYLSGLWKMPVNEVEYLIDSNFRALLEKIR